MNNPIHTLTHTQGHPRPWFLLICGISKERTKKDEIDMKKRSSRHKKKVKGEVDMTALRSEKTISSCNAVDKHANAYTPFTRSSWS